MNAKFKSSFYNRKGVQSRIYVLTGTKEEIEAYKAHQGVNYQEDEHGNPLLFTEAKSRTKSGVRLPNRADVVIDKNGNYWIDTTEVEQLMEDNAIGGALGNIAAEKLGKLWTFVEPKTAPVNQATDAGLNP